MTKKRMTQLLAFAFVIGSAMAMSTSALAWDTWGPWAPSSQIGECTCDTLVGELSGASLVSNGNRQLNAIAYDICGARTQARGWPKRSNGTYVQVTAVQQSGYTASTSSPHDLTHSRCRCDYILC